MTFEEPFFKFQEDVKTNVPKENVCNKKKTP